MKSNFSEIINLLPVLIPLLILELGLMIFALINIVKRKRVRGGSKAMWIIIVVLFQLIGPIIYFAFGREEEIIDGDKD